jgi:hypothetical protein
LREHGVIIVITEEQQEGCQSCQWIPGGMKNGAILLKYQLFLECDDIGSGREFNAKNYVWTTNLK